MAPNSASNRAKTHQKETAARERRRFLVQVRVNAEELAAIDAYAESMGVDRSKAMRMAPARAQATPSASGGVRELAEIAAGVQAIKRVCAGIGNNANQIARVLNSYEKGGDRKSVGDLVMSGLASDALAELARAVEAQNSELAGIRSALERLV